jgi:SOS-response transcriptional repressor LexA
MLAVPSMGLGDWLRDERRKIRMSQDDLSKSSGYSKGYISQVENEFNHSTGKATNPSAEAIRAFVRALRANGSTVTEEEAFQAAGMSFVPSALPPVSNLEDPLAASLAALGAFPLEDNLPLLGLVPAGDPDRRYQEARGGVAERFGAQFLVEVEGDSMEPHYHNGDILVVCRTAEPVLGDNVIALVSGDSVCKKLTASRYDEVSGDIIYTLSPSNHKYREIHASDVQFQGVIVGRFIPERRRRK